MLPPYRIPMHAYAINSYEFPTLGLDSKVLPGGSERSVKRGFRF